MTAFRQRVGEMREPPLGLDVVPDLALEQVFDEILAAPSTAELLVGIYEVALPALDAALARHRADTNPLTDAPSLRIARFARLEIDDMLQFGRSCIAQLVDHETRFAMEEWLDLLHAALKASGGLDGADLPVGEIPPRRHSAQPYVYDATPRRDERFQDLWNQGVNAEAFLYNPSFPDRAKTLMMLFKRLREIDVPEMMASILAETKDKPWGYYHAMSRQLWDEARHAMMGEVGFAASGVDWTLARITHNWSTRLNTECTPLEAPRGTVLYRARLDAQDRQEVRMGSGCPLGRSVDGDDPGLRLGR